MFLSLKGDGGNLYSLVLIQQFFRTNFPLQSSFAPTGGKYNYDYFLSFFSFGKCIGINEFCYHKYLKLGCTDAQSWRNLSGIENWNLILVHSDIYSDLSLMWPMASLVSFFFFFLLCCIKHDWHSFNDHCIWKKSWLKLCRDKSLIWF